VPATVRLRVTPGSRKNELSLSGAEFNVRIAARAVGGKANSELVRYLSQTLGVPPSRIQILTGRSSRWKVIWVDGMVDSEVIRRLTAAAVG
jgi:uncharacterized protein